MMFKLFCDRPCTGQGLFAIQALGQLFYYDIIGNRLTIDMEVITSMPLVKVCI